MSAMENIHVLAGVPYWEAIALATIGLKIMTFPITLKTIQGGARMALIQPQLVKLQAAMNANMAAKDDAVALKLQNEMKELFVKNKVNPLMSFVWSFALFPVFIGQFIALREFGHFYPDYASGGCLWFTDLSAMDPTYALPVINSLSFLLMIELGAADGMQNNPQAGMFKNVMRGMAVIMVPLTASLPSVCFLFGLFFGSMCVCWSF
jgi:membrane protein insertase Oxa1/YidC/SpoIIIJ